MPILKFEKDTNTTGATLVSFTLLFTLDSTREEIELKHAEIKQSFISAGYSPCRKNSDLLHKQSINSNKIIILQAMPIVLKTISLTISNHNLNKKTAQVLENLAMENL